jgi:histamine receptor H1
VNVSRQRTRKRALIMISVVWCLASLWLVPVVGWHHITRKGVREVPANVCDTEYATNTTFKVITAFINFYVPLAIMIGLYTKIFIEASMDVKFTPSSE